MKKTLTTIFLIACVCLSSMQQKPMYAGETEVPFDRELAIPAFLSPRLYDRITESDIGVAYPESLLKKGIEAMVMVELLLGKDGTLSKVCRTQTYQLTGYKYRYDEIYYSAIAEYQKKSPGLKDFEDEVLKALSKSTYKAEKEIQSSRKEISKFFFDRYDVYARALTEAADEAALHAAVEACRKMNLEIESVDEEKGIVTTKAVSGMEGERKCESFFVLKFMKAAGPDTPSEIRALRVMKLFYPPYGEGKRYFRIVFPYHQMSKDLLTDICRRLDDEDATVEFISPRKSMRDLFPIEGLHLMEIYSDVVIQILEGGVKKPKGIKQSKGEMKYPRDLLHQNVEGFIVLHILIDSDGTSNDMEIAWIMPEDRGLEEAAISAYSSWKFKPAMKEGKAVKSILRLVVRFNIR